MVSPITTPCENEVHTVPIRITGLARTGSGRNGSEAFIKPFDCGVPLHNSCRHDRDILCDQPRIEAIVLSQHAAGTGELTKLVRVDTSHRQSRREQGTDDSALVTTARLKANCG